MPARLKISVGDVFNRLTVVRELEPLKGHRRFETRCSCSNSKVVLIDNLKTTKSWGCLRKELATTHGYTQHSLYSVWKNMLARCYNKNVKAYSDYGGRGIEVCKLWYSNAGKFIEWSLANGWHEGLEIDRKDNDGNYTPNNCRFVTRVVNARNRRNNIVLTTKTGERISLVEAVERFGKVPYSTALARISRGWKASTAVITPLRY